MIGKRMMMQEALFYGFRIEDYVPDDHLLRPGSVGLPRQ
ncbi:hypothetical protein SAMN06295955_108193 [Sphingopyxis indica]|uniref:Transposase n=2 Tax=Sphingopyxis indica TaxID=436663 RepID=A0A239IW94_9SPHN|nr:hypothetical protein SAMN06295955_108193 [Sphingopyxis indica]